ncbi:hypothetical protein DUNSADRAFT_9484 [Dunaliella salina]|uniref:SRA1/Sec31 domain-containing protein n=1 Tax=Dunaliella salina TaxID=3046 RepID=A0ABQ7GHC6_DUNSA|nr:hypothetical protein DUNSADRAFT_9484 [Dunaliella salina]|eukprot:KAF5833999.1 hypothetical protein DUNSADRAFT_9484 [Dunaliella salina]
MPTTTPATTIPQASAPVAANPLAPLQQQQVAGPGGMAAAMGATAAQVPAVPGVVMPGAAAVAPAQPPKPQPPPPPAGPPANISVATVDTSRVPPDQQPIVASLVNLHASCTPFATNPAKKREMDDNSKKIGQLLWRLNAGEVSEGVVPKLMQLCMAIDAADWHAANHIQVQMTTTDWDECGYWLSAVKRLIKMRMQGM